jgi:hypothetical protein
LKNNEVKNLIEQFGKNLVEVARDYTISLALDSLKRKEKLPPRIMNVVNELSDEQLFALKYLLVSNIDTAMHDTLWSIESYSNYKLIIETPVNPINIEDECDSITGISLDFIEKYSKYNTEETFLETGEIEKKPKSK